MALGTFGFVTQATGLSPWREWVFVASFMALLGGGWDQLTRFFGGGGPQPRP